MSERLRTMCGDGRNAAYPHLGRGVFQHDHSARFGRKCPDMVGRQAGLAAAYAVNDGSEASRGLGRSRCHDADC